MYDSQKSLTLVISRNHENESSIEERSPLITKSQKELQRSAQRNNGSMQDVQVVGKKPQGTAAYRKLNISQAIQDYRQSLKHSSIS